MTSNSTPCDPVLAAEDSSDTTRPLNTTSLRHAASHGRPGTTHEHASADTDQRPVTPNATATIAALSMVRGSRCNRSAAAESTSPRAARASVHENGIRRPSRNACTEDLDTTAAPSDSHVVADRPGPRKTACGLAQCRARCETAPEWYGVATDYVGVGGQGTPAQARGGSPTPLARKPPISLRNCKARNVPVTTAPLTRV
jgi:hypothetical protein